VEKYLNRLCQQTRLLVCSGNHDGDARSAADESICNWLREAKTGQLFVDGDSVEIGDTLITICPWWDGPVSQAEVESLLAQDFRKPKQRWIWIHHSPPDKSPVSWAGKSTAATSASWTGFISMNPTWFSPATFTTRRSIPRVRGTTALAKRGCFNPGRQIGPCPTYLVFDLDRMSVEWFSVEDQQARQLDAPAGSRITGALREAAGA